MFEDKQILVINLANRKDRWHWLTVEMEEMGIENYERFDAIPGGASGCAASHYECLKKGEGDLVIFEDDVVFEPGAKEVLEKAISQLPDDYDIFYLGANVKQPAQRYSENLFTAKDGVHTTHAMMYSAKGRKEILRHFNPNIDKLPIDHWFWTKGLSILNCYICYPIQAFQRPGYTDIRLAEYDYRNEMLQNQKLHMK